MYISIFFSYTNGCPGLSWEMTEKGKNILLGPLSCLPPKSDNLSWTPAAHVGGEDTPCLASDLHMHAMVCTFAHTTNKGFVFS